MNNKILVIFSGIVLVLLGMFSWKVAQVTAAANLTISTATINSAGKSMAVTISGVSGALSPTSGVTGFSVTLTTGGKTALVQLGTVTASGTTVTIPLSAAIPASATVTVSLAISGGGSNLTDGSSNTPSGSGNTNVATTNNSTITTAVAGFDDVNSKIYIYGISATSSYNGHNYSSELTGSGELHVGVMGTEADIQVLGGQTFYINVDGTTSTVTSQGNLGGFVWVPLFSGLPNANHYVIMTGISTYGFTDADATVRVTGSAPAFYTSSIDAPQLNVLSPPLSTYAAFDDSPATSTAAIPGAYIFANGDASVRFSAAVTAISVFSYPYPGAISLKLFQDGVQIATTTTQSSATGLTTIATGLSSSTHTYQIDASGANANVNWNLYSVVLAGGTGLNSVVQPSHYTLGWYGDSIINQGFSVSCSTTGDMRFGDPYIVSHAVSEGFYRVGQSGEPVSTFLRDNTSLMTSISPLPKIVVLEGGINDCDLGVTLGNATTSGTFTGDMKTMISNMASGLASGSVILVRGISPSSTYCASPANYIAAQQTAVNYYMSGSPSIPAYFMNTNGWNNDTTDICSEPHQSPAGYAKIANREIPVFSGLIGSSSYLAVGPASGTYGQGSTNFTITLANTATFTGDQTVTLSDGGNGGKFTPSVGSAATSSVTVTPTASTTSFTFTYTPASVGAKTIAFTDSQNVWKDPSSLTYTVSSTSTPPQSLSAISGNTQVSLSWSTPSSTGGASLTQYDVLDRFTGSSTFIQIATTSASQTNATTTSLTNGQSYDFEIVAENSVGSSTPSNLVSSTPSTIPSAPTSTVATAGNAQVSVAFTPGFSGGSAILYYTAISNPGNISASSTGSLITVSGLSNGQAYIFTVTATNGIGTSVSSSASNSVTPSAPSSGGGGGGVSVEVAAGGAPVTNNYGITGGTTPTVASTSTITTTTTSSSTTTVTITGTTASLEAELASLEAQLSALEAQAGSTGVTPPSISFSFTHDLQLYDNDAEVKDLQTYLDTHGFPVASSGSGSPGNETTFFGINTYNALVKFQAFHGIHATGYFGVITRTWVNGH